MAAESNLQVLISTMAPRLNDGDYVFVSTTKIDHINSQDVLMLFQEAEGTTLILDKVKADALNLTYDFVAAWITLTVHSALDAVGLTAAFAAALGEANISCNVVAGFYHDHIFVAHKDAEKAVSTLEKLAATASKSIL